MKILSFGEIIWDVYPDRRALGGAPLNFAIHFAARGGSAYMLSAVGDADLASALSAATDYAAFVISGKI
jgi:fructokinase